MIKCLIVDDEQQSRNALRDELKDLAHKVQVIGEADSVVTAIAAISELKPDVVLLDVELSDGTGFDVLDALGSHLHCKIIFVTAYSQYAIRAFRVSAMDYLLKPVNGKLLAEALDKAIALNEQRTQLLKENYNTLHKRERIAFASTEGYSLHQIADIIRCESDSNYCYVFFKNGDKTLLSKTLKEMEELLQGSGFERVHKSHLVNMAHVKRYLNKDNGLLCMADGSLVPVAQRKKTDILTLLQQMAG